MFNKKKKGGGGGGGGALEDQNRALLNVNMGKSNDD